MSHLVCSVRRSLLRLTILLPLSAAPFKTVHAQDVGDAGAEAVPLYPVSIDAGIPTPAAPRLTPVVEDDAYGASAQVERPAAPGEFELYGTGSKFNVPLEEVPASVSLVDQRTLRERGVVDLQQALGLLPGVMPTFQYGGFQNIRVRGFQAPTMFDGRRDPRALLADSAPQVGLWDVDRLELLRGTSSLLYGYGSVGGAVNLIRKRPSRAAAYELEAGYGLPNQWRAHLGAQGPIGDDLSFRVDVGHTTHENFRDQRTERTQATAALRYTPTRKQSIGLRLAYANDHYNTDVGIPTIEDPSRPGQWRLPDHTPLQNRYATANDHLDYQRLELSADYRYDFTKDVRLEARGSFSRDYYDYLAAESLTIVPPGGMANTTSLPRVSREYLWFKRRWAPVFGQLELYSKLRTGFVEHQLVVGYQLDMLNGRSDRGDPDDQLGNESVDPGSVDFVHPIDKAPPVTFVRNAYDHYKHLVQALYAFDHMHITEQLIVTGGVRLDRLRSDTRREFVDSESNVEVPDPSSGMKRAPNKRRDTQVTGQVGVVYTPIEPLIAYTSYGTAYMPMLVSPGAPEANSYTPERSQQFEGGLRLRSALKRHLLSLDLAGYFIRKRNLLVPRGTDDFAQAGKVDSRGLDLSARYRAPRYVEIDLGYALNDARYEEFVSFDPVSEQNLDRSGNHVDFAPVHSGNAWLRLLMNEHVGFGIGTRFMGEQFADPENRLPMKRYALLDASLWFGNERATFTVSASNLLDQHQYFTSAINAWAVNPQLTPGPGRELFGMLRLTL